VSSVLLLVGTVVLGILAGLVPALLLGAAVGAIGPPRRRRLEAPAAPAAAMPAPPRPAAPAAPPPPPPSAELPAAPDPPRPALRTAAGLLLDPEPDDDEAPAGPAERRHGELYDEEFADQLAHLEALRIRITTQLAFPAEAGNGRPTPT
jgi:hypothetical protein